MKDCTACGARGTVAFLLQDGEVAGELRKGETAFAVCAACGASPPAAPTPEAPALCAYKRGLCEGVFMALQQWPDRIPQRLERWVEALEVWCADPAAEAGAPTPAPARPKRHRRES